MELISFFSPLLLLFSMDFLDLSGILLTAGIALMFFLYGNEILFDDTAIVLVIFSAFYFVSILLYEGFSVDKIIKYAIAPWGSYVLAFNLLKINEELSVQRYVELLFFGFFIHGALNLFETIRILGLDFNSNYRLAYDFWQRRQISVTTASLYYSPMVLMAFSWLLCPCSMRKKLISGVIIAIGVLATLLYQNRTLILAIAIVMCAGIWLFFSDRFISEYRKSNALKIGIIAILVGLVLWFGNIGGLRSFVESTSFYGRLSGSNGEGQDRTDIWFSFLFWEGWKYPLGGNKAVLYKNKPYVHNAWLDVFRKAGIIPFITYLIYTVSTFQTIRLLIRSRQTHESYRVIALSMIGLAATFMVEPIFDANPYIFYLPFLVSGGIKGRMYR